MSLGIVWKCQREGNPFKNRRACLGFCPQGMVLSQALLSTRKQESTCVRSSASGQMCESESSGDILTWARDPSATTRSATTEKMRPPAHSRIRHAARTVLPCFFLSEWKHTWQVLIWLFKCFPPKWQLLELTGCSLRLEFITLSLIPMPRQKAEHSTYISRPVRGNKE